ncbi:MAG: hypothetical protein DRN05_06725, partial [Thermoplasmata archaeon]
MKKVIFFFLFLFLLLDTEGGGLYIDGREHISADVLTFRGMSKPSDSKSNQARIYFDDIDLTLKISRDNSAYYDILDSG